MRFNCPVFTFENILASAGILLDENAIENDFNFGDETEEEEVEEETAENITIEELENQLKTALENEEYELASKIRDQINKRTS